MEFSKDTIFLVNYGRQNCEDMHSWGPGMRSCYVIHYVIRGSGYLECGKK
ncbi:MAG: AraC family ligand binding domain-containing protein [Fusicatenibacter sp.]|nr:AraC family ligand binding domain-containing protein [Lachnospiraceae bacterium]MDY2937287.1 AraC family ligand binding domain-containing protein [Fusicatenibacter sp.]